LIIVPGAVSVYDLKTAKLAPKQRSARPLRRCSNLSNIYLGVSTAINKAARISIEKNCTSESIALDLRYVRTYENHAVGAMWFYRSRPLSDEILFEISKVKTRDALLPQSNCMTGGLQGALEREQPFSFTALVLLVL